MVDLNKLSQKALGAAMRGGTAGWGHVGSSDRHIRYIEALPKRRGRRKKCYCGCGKPVTHAGMANGICLGQGCEFSMARWVRTGSSRSTVIEQLEHQKARLEAELAARSVADAGDTATGQQLVYQVCQLMPNCV